MKRRQKFHERPPNVNDTVRRLNPQIFGTVGGVLGVIPATVEKPARRIRQSSKLTDSETSIQQEVIRRWATLCGDYNLSEDALMAFPLQGARTKRNGARMKAEGMRKGTPDLLLTVPTLNAPGLWIEMKSARGKLSVSQKVMLKSLAERGYSTAVCRTADEATDVIREYLRWQRPV